MGHDIVDLAVSQVSSSTELKSSSIFFVVMLFAYSYVIGHLISPLGDFIRPIIEKFVPEKFHILRTAVSPKCSWLPKHIKTFLEKETNEDSSHPLPSPVSKNDKGIYTSLIFIWADWLRLERPDVGARIVKLRAEYRMYIGLTIAATITPILHVLSILMYQHEFDIILAVVSVCVIVLSAAGYAQSYGTFQWSVINNYYAAKCMPNSHANKEVSNA